MNSSGAQYCKYFCPLFTREFVLQWLSMHIRFSLCNGWVLQGVCLLVGKRYAAQQGLFSSLERLKYLHGVVDFILHCASRVRGHCLLRAFAATLSKEASVDTCCGSRYTVLRSREVRLCGGVPQPLPCLKRIMYFSLCCTDGRSMWCEPSPSTRLFRSFQTVRWIKSS